MRRVRPRPAQWWVPGGGPAPGSMLAVLIPVPGGDMVWQCHAPTSLLAARGVPFQPAAGGREGASSHASSGDAAAAAGGAPGGGGSPGGGQGQGGARERCLAVFEGMPGLAPFLEAVRDTPPGQVTEHGLYQRTPEQIPDHAWGRGPVTLAGDSAHTGEGRRARARAGGRAFGRVGSCKGGRAARGACKAAAPPAAPGRPGALLPHGGSPSPAARRAPSRRAHAYVLERLPSRPRAPRQRTSTAPAWPYPLRTRPSSAATSSASD